MATGFKHLIVTEYYITFDIDNWDDVPKYMEVLTKLPNVPQELEDLVTGKKTEVLVPPRRMDEITTGFNTTGQRPLLRWNRGLGTCLKRKMESTSS